MKKTAGRRAKWEVILTSTAARQLDALDAAVQKRIVKFLRERIETAENPRILGRRLVDADGLYRFRVGDYRLISCIDDGAVRVLVVAVGHRSAVYKKL